MGVFMKYQCLLFDLDGTLVDSRADLTKAVNLMLGELGDAPLAEETVTKFVGEGARLLVERSLRAVAVAPPSVEEIDRALAIFKRHYREHLLDQTRLYPEVGETLDRLAGIPKAVITNKPYDFTVALLGAFQLLDHFTVILGGDSMPQRKPSPMMLLEAARRCQAEPTACLMIGDSKIDIAAGKNAGMKTCGHVGGFRGAEELHAAGADFLIERFSELPGLIL